MPFATAAWLFRLAVGPSISVGVDEVKVSLTPGLIAQFAHFDAQPLEAGVFRRNVKPYLDHVRDGGAYQSREYDFGFDCMEVSAYERPRARAR